ncbi:hypothetical protein BGZ99_006084 [Dissophora globulifera]|uniref:LYC1 C-terminal domain-containing protein n=1 Tax=Dissophora globulifera TaxID=979702 RepID=A0A9P6RHE9_9FUNG|nr:hypothetical protein BGZ99_006084 [Dissophora globulifera]
MSRPAAELEIVRAMSPDVIRHVWLNNKRHFAPDMSDELWLERAALRTSLDLGPGVEHKIWILVPKGRANDPSAVLSAAHTYDRAGLISDVIKTERKSDEVSVHLRDTIIVYVLLVFTPAEHRKRGYAKQLLVLLNDQLKRQTDPVVELSFLYSSIGQNFYESAGWSTIRSRELLIQVSSHRLPELSPSLPSQSTQGDAAAAVADNQGIMMEDITEFNVQRITDDDIELIRSEMRERALANANASPSLSLSQSQRVAVILPEGRLFQGQLAMARFTTGRVAMDDRPISRIGVQLISTGIVSARQQQPVFIIWTYLMPSKLLLILRVRYQTVHQLQCLLWEAMKEAHKWGITAVSLWDLDDIDAVAATGIPNTDRSGCWSCLCQLPQGTSSGGGVMTQALASVPLAAPVELVLNEAYIFGL